jgi:hypothetical protein
VMVVPILAPRITPTDLARGSNPALTKLTTITVVADDDCMIAVIRKPVTTPITRFEVMEDNIPRMRWPATFCNASLIIFIPRRNRPSDPTIVRKLNTILMIWLCDYFIKKYLKGKVKRSKEPRFKKHKVKIIIKTFSWKYSYVPFGFNIKDMINPQ